MKIAFCDGSIIIALIYDEYICLSQMYISKENDNEMGLNSVTRAPKISLNFEVFIWRVWK